MKASGYTGNMLHVDLGTGTSSVHTHGEDWYQTYFGGSCMIAEQLLKGMAPATDPLGPENVLVFAAGPLTGISLPGLGRNSAGARSPLTGAIGFSEAGGFWGTELKRAGYDGIVIRGQAAKACYLLLIDDHLEIRPATHLQGLPTTEVEQIIKTESADAATRIAQCGVAGEKRVRFASIVNDLTHFYGRTGLGAVMASKNVRAIGVRGHHEIAVADGALIQELRLFMRENRKKLAGSLQDLGTANVLLSQNATSGLPTRNFENGQFEGAEEISGEMLRNTLLVGRGTCYSCSITCKRVVETSGPWNVNRIYGGPEYETIGAFGSLCGVSSLEAISRANELCAQYCMDTISCGVTIAFAMECYERGLLRAQDTGGVELRFGNSESMIEMVRQIGEREGLGDLLAEGSARAAQQIGRGAEELAMHSKGQELPLHDPRVKYGYGLSVALSPTGAEHMSSMPDTSYVKDAGRLKPWGITSPLPADDLGPQKVRMVLADENWKYFRGCAVQCALVPWTGPQMVDMVRAATGWAFGLQELGRIGERTRALSRLFNLREGFTARDDALPKRIFRPFSTGPAAGKGATPELFEQARGEYYAQSGWDRESGRPHQWKLDELRIGWAGSEQAKAR